jgi:hypothetical protein
MKPTTSLLVLAVQTIGWSELLIVCPRIRIVLQVRSSSCLHPLALSLELDFAFPLGLVGEQILHAQSNGSTGENKYIGPTWTEPG